MMDFREAAKLVDWKLSRHIACVDPDCGSSDAASITEVFTEEGSSYLRYKCFSCGLSTNNKPKPKDYMTNSQKSASKEVPQDSWQNPSEPIRGITVDTLRKYGVMCSGSLTRFPYRKEGSEGAFKIRDKDKRFHSSGPIGSSEPLFGMSLFPQNPERSIVVTEGEWDSLAAYQMLSAKTSVVSLKNGASAAEGDIKKAFEYLMGFEKVILSFDNDEHGKKAIAVAAEILGPKCYIMPAVPDLKDANDYLVANRTAEYVNAYFRAKQYAPDGIVPMADLRDRIGKAVEPDGFFPFKGLNEVLGGIFRKRLYMILAGSGSGKSTLLRQIAYHLWSTEPQAKIGMMFLEESAEQTATHLMGLEAGRAAHLPDAEVPWTMEERYAVFDKVAQGDRLLFWDNRMENLTTESVLRQMKYMVKVLGVNYIMFDHVSMVISGSAEGDERRNIDNFMTALRQFVEATGVTVFAINHLAKTGGSKTKTAEEGGRVRLSDARGSGAVYQLSDVVIGCERNQQEKDKAKASEVTYRVLKNRPTGTVGEAGTIKYARLLDRLIEVNQQGKTLGAL